MTHDTRLRRVCTRACAWTPAITPPRLVLSQAGLGFDAGREIPTHTCCVTRAGYPWYAL